MPVQQSHYETLLAEYSNSEAAIALLKQHRTYLEMIPSMRRPDESLITIPLPVVRLRDGVSYTGKSGISIAPGQAMCLPCDLGIMMCDPEWKVKVGAEIFIFIHRPNEDFSDLLMRWRMTQVCLDQGYEWVMPHHYSHIYSQEGEKIYPLFVLFSETPERIKRGLQGANLPFVIPALDTTVDSVDYQSIDELDVLDFEHHPEWKSWGEREQ
ncbi:hypothetical protein ACL6C3_30640 [Capilliphycus salinus ALCB114379]|uniref:hypothetical protein n=1 Tax=Capilliphycus salinus TaxID=2768948 RepID=UPI0039A6AC74